MGSSLGPNVTADNLILALDCADTKSYAGDITINYAAGVGYGSLGDWVAEGTAEKISAGYNFQGQPVYMCNTSVGLVYQGITRTISGLRTAASGGSVTVSVWVKNPNPTSYNFYAYIGHDFSSTRTLAADSDWQRIQWTVLESSMANDVIEYRPYTNTSGVYIHMTMPQVEVGTYATQYTSGARSTLQNIQNLVGSPYGGTWIASNTSTITFNSSSPTSGGSYQALHGGWGLSNGQIPRYSRLVLKYTISSNNAQDSSGNPILGGSLMGTQFGPGDIIDNNTNYNTVPLTVGTHYIHINADGEAFSDGRERVNLYLRTNGSVISTGSIVMTENHLYYSDNGMIFPVNGVATGINQYQVGDIIYPAGSNGSGGARYLDFDGSNDYIILPDDIGYTDAVSVFAWFKRDTNTGILGGYHIICGTHYLELSVNQGGNYLRNGIVVNGTRYVSNDGSAIGTDTWHYVGFTWSTSDYYKRSYVDGVNVGTQSTGSTGTSNYSFSGRSLGMWNGSSYALNGKIAVYQVYNKALTQAEVIQNYNSTKSRFL